MSEKLNHVTLTLRSIAVAKARLSYLTWGHGWLVTLTSALVAAPGYLQHRLDFGGIMVVVGAFGQVQSSMRWLVANYSGVADWRSLVCRLHDFSVNLANAEKERSQATLIRDNLDGYCAQELQVRLASGRVIANLPFLKIEPGDRVLLTGESGCGKSSLLRAIAGIWPWATGNVSKVDYNSAEFLPQRPYFPNGTLASAIAYPESSDAYTELQMQRMLVLVNLPELSECLNVRQQWESILSLGQQQRLSFARMLLKKPSLIFMDESTSALDDSNEARLMNLVATELPLSSILSVGHRASLAQYHVKSVTLERFEAQSISQAKSITHPESSPESIQERRLLFGAPETKSDMTQEHFAFA